MAEFYFLPQYCIFVLFVFASLYSAEFRFLKFLFALACRSFAFAVLTSAPAILGFASLHHAEFRFLKFLFALACRSFAFAVLTSAPAILGFASLHPAEFRFLKFLLARVFHSFGFALSSLRPSLSGLLSVRNFAIFSEFVCIQVQQAFHVRISIPLLLI